jgi:P22_AR N-terminal domain
MKASKKSPSQFRVPVCDRMIEAVETDDGKMLVSLKSVCESFGMDYAVQLTKLQSPDFDWATILISREVADDGTCRELAVIDVESLPLWLVMIEPVEVAPEFRPGLVRFQDEAKSVLSAWFPARSFDGLTSAPRPADMKRSGTTPGLRRKKARSGVAPLRLVCDYHEDKIVEFEAVPRPLGQRRDLEYMTLREYCDRYGVTDSQGQPLNDKDLAEIETTLKAMSAARGIPVKKVRAKQAP